MARLARLYLASLWILLVLSGNGAFAAENPPLKHAALIPQWVPHAQFAGYYVAKELGIYERHGIDLTILPGGPQHEPELHLADGTAQFATMWLSSGIQLRSRGASIVNIAQTVQRSALMLIAKKSRGILTPQDMQGKKVGLWGGLFRVQPRAFFRKYDLKVREIPQSFSVDLFLRDGIHVASAMWYNEYHTIINSGLDPHELTTFFFYDHALNFPEDGIYTLEAIIDKDPALCDAFVRASREGWRHAFARPKEAVDIVMTYLKEHHIRASRAHQNWMLKKIQNLMTVSGAFQPDFALQPKDYMLVAESLAQSGLIQGVPDFRGFYRPCGMVP